MVKMVYFRLCVFYHNKKKVMKENAYSIRMGFRRALTTKVTEKS